MSKKTLYDLGKEYYEQADILHSQISAVREKLRVVSPVCKEAYRLKSTLSVLYRQRSEAVEIARILCAYYDRKEDAA